MTLQWKMSNVQSSCEESFNVLVVSVGHRCYRDTTCCVMSLVKRNKSMARIISWLWLDRMDYEMKEVSLVSVSLLFTHKKPGAGRLC